jgi:hypothetical protein
MRLSSLFTIGLLQNRYATLVACRLSGADAFDNAEGNTGGPAITRVRAAGAVGDPGSLA